MMANSDPEGQIFLNTLTRIKDSFSCSPLFLFIYLFLNKLPEVPEYAKMQRYLIAGVR